MEWVGSDINLFGAGLGIGLLVALWVWFSKLSTRSTLNKELEAKTAFAYPDEHHSQGV